MSHPIGIGLLDLSRQELARCGFSAFRDREISGERRPEMRGHVLPGGCWKLQAPAVTEAIDELHRDLWILVKHLIRAYRWRQPEVRPSPVDLNFW